MPALLADGRRLGECHEGLLVDITPDMSGSRQLDRNAGRVRVQEMAPSSISPRATTRGSRRSPVESDLGLDRDARARSSNSRPLR